MNGQSTVRSSTSGAFYDYSRACVGTIKTLLHRFAQTCRAFPQHLPFLPAQSSNTAPAFHACYAHARNCVRRAF
jgi:hypothetical protein